MEPRFCASRCAISVMGRTGPPYHRLMGNPQEYEGYTGQIAVDGDAIVLSRRGLAAKTAGLAGDPRRIPLAAISGVAFKPATRLVNGSLRLGLGGAEPASEHDAGTRDSVLFRHKDNEAFQRLYQWLESVVAYNRAHGIDPTAVPFDAGSASVTERIQGRIDASQDRADRAATQAVAARTEKWSGRVGADRPDIAQAAARLGWTLGGKREIKHLREHLHDDETVRFLAQGTYDGKQGIVALTDQRLLFVFNGVMSKAQEDFPLRLITSVQTKSGLVNGDLRVTVAGRLSTISNVVKGDLGPLAAAVREGMAATQHEPAAPAAPAAATNPDPYEALTKLAQLRDAGVLSDEEFAAKKQEILARL